MLVRPLLGFHTYYMFISYKYIDMCIVVAVPKDALYYTIVATHGN